MKCGGRLISMLPNLKREAYLKADKEMKRNRAKETQ
jgi:hypothetical protein